MIMLTLEALMSFSAILQKDTKLKHRSPSSYIA